MPHQESSLFFLCLLAVCLLFLSCSTQAHKYKPTTEKPAENEQTHLPRADPVYLQYLERQSMLAKSSEMARIVSGSELAWRASANPKDPNVLLNFADTWLAVHPLTVLTSSHSSTFQQLNAPAIWPVFREAGVKGLYVAPIQGSGALWSPSPPEIDTGDDVVQYGFSRAAGKEEQYQLLINCIINKQMLLGSDIIPAAVGIGPDFFLATRNVREYPGIFCMVDIPQDSWEHLPELAQGGENAPLTQSHVKALHGKGLLPKSMQDEVSPLGQTGGWATTGVIRGVDGNNRRWVYRYYRKPGFAVLNWEDPSRTAHRILSGSAVRQVGLQGQALLGLHFEALQGLEPASQEHTPSATFSVEPALTAAQTISREIQRYGGWSWLRNDNLPLDSVREFLQSGVNFVFDSVFSPAAEHALLTGNAALARFMADEALRLGIDMRRVVHTTPNQDGLNYSLPHLGLLATGTEGEKAAAFRKNIQLAVHSITSLLMRDNRVYTPALGIATATLGSSASEKALSDGHLLLVFFKALQPGVLMLSGQDLAGVMPLAGADDLVAGNRKGYTLISSSAALTVSAQGVPKAPLLYPAPDVQVHQPDSFLRRAGGFLRARTQYGIAKGALAARPDTKNKGSIALLTRMHGNKGYLLSVCNFSRDTVTETISLSGRPGIDMALSNVTSIATGGSHSIAGKSVTVTLGPWQGRALLFNGGSGTDATHPVHDADCITPIPVDAQTPGT